MANVHVREKGQKEEERSQRVKEKVTDGQDVCRIFNDATANGDYDVEDVKGETVGHAFEANVSVHIVSFEKAKVYKETDDEGVFVAYGNEKTNRLASMDMLVMLKENAEGINKGDEEVDDVLG